MAVLEIIEPHNLGKEEALKRIKELLPKLKQQYGDRITNLREQWEGHLGEFSFIAMGYEASGSLAVSNSVVLLVGEVDLGVLGSMFLGTIESAIRQQARALLA